MIVLACAEGQTDRQRDRQTGTHTHTHIDARDHYTFRDLYDSREM